MDPKERNSTEETTITMTSSMLKAMANPLRRRIVSTLSAMDSARATDLAERLDIPANSLSFHLRVLASAGIVEEAPELARDRRDRVWRAVRGRFSVGSPEAPSAADDALVLKSYVGQQGQELVRQLQAVLDWGNAYATGSEPDMRGVLDLSNLMLNADEVKVLENRIMDVVGEIKRESLRNSADGSDRRLWHLTTMMAREDLPGLAGD